MRGKNFIYREIESISPEDLFDLWRSVIKNDPRLCFYASMSSEDFSYGEEVIKILPNFFLCFGVTESFLEHNQGHCAGEIKSRSQIERLTAAEINSEEGQISAAFRKIQSLMVGGDLVAAQALIERLLPLFPGNPRLWIEISTIKLRQGHPSAAASLLALVRRWFSDEPDGYLWGSNALTKANMPQEALRVIRAGIARFEPRESIWWSVAGEAAVLAGEFQAVGDYSLVLRQLAPAEIWGWLWGAEAALSMQNYQDAISLINRANAIDRSNVHVYTIASKIFIRLIDNPVFSDATRDLGTLLLSQTPCTSAGHVPAIIDAIHSIYSRDPNRYSLCRDVLIEVSKEIGIDKHDVAFFHLALGSGHDLSNKLLVEITQLQSDSPKHILSGLSCHGESVRIFLDLMKRPLGIEASSRLSLFLFAGAHDASNLATYAESLAIPSPPLPLRLASPATVKQRLFAICVSGQLRGFEIAYHSWKSAGLIDAKTKIFVHSWFNVGSKTPYYPHAHRSFHPNFAEAFFKLGCKIGQEGLVLLYPMLFSLYSSSSEVTTEQVCDIYSTRSVVLEDDRDRRFNDFSNAKKMYYKCEMAWRLMSEAGSFDAVMRVRPDKPILRIDPTFSPFSLSERSAKGQKVFAGQGYYVDPCHGICMDDQVAIGAPQVMEAYSTAYSQTLDGTPFFSEYFGGSAKFLGHVNFAVALLANRIAAEEISGCEFGWMVDPKKPSSFEIFEAIKKDAVTRSNAFDAELLFAVEQDLVAGF